MIDFVRYKSGTASANKAARIAGVAVSCLVILRFATSFGVADDANMVTQKGRSFHPRAITIQQGQAVHVVNDDEFVHQAYVDDPNFHFESQEQPPGDAFDIPFTAKGEFDVFCHIHPKMKLHVTVK